MRHALRCTYTSKHSIGRIGTLNLNRYSVVYPHDLAGFPDPYADGIYQCTPFGGFLGACAEDLGMDDVLAAGDPVDDRHVTGVQD